MTDKQARNRLLEVAAKYVGYKEKATNRDLDSFEGNAGKGNWTRFGREVDAVSGWMNGSKNGYEWCAIYVCACFLEAFEYPRARKMLFQPERSLAAGCGYAAPSRARSRPARSSPARSTSASSSSSPAAKRPRSTPAPSRSTAAPERDHAPRPGAAGLAHAGCMLVPSRKGR